jgi:hypothetical protein
MLETLKTLVLESADSLQVAGPMHRLQPEKPGMVMKCPH